jgi:hypothetical protein
MKKISSKLFVALSGIMALGVSAPAVAQSANGSGSIKIVRSVFVRMCWRPEPESNRRARICSPLRHHSAIGPLNNNLPKQHAIMW